MDSGSPGRRGLDPAPGGERVLALFTIELSRLVTDGAGEPTREVGRRGGVSGGVDADDGGL
jgi:hypothetical protein